MNGNALDLAPYEVILAGDAIIPTFRVRHIDISEIENQKVTLHTDDGSFVALGFDAITIVMQLKPSALEGRRLRWKQGAWAAHNVIWHPVMQILVWLGYKKAAIKLHDWSTPSPRGFR